MQPEIVVALIAMPPALIIAFAQYRTTRSVGRKNGRGTLQESLDDLHGKVEANADFLLAHTRRDDVLFDRLESSANRMRDLIGEPGPFDTQEPLIPYVHKIIHRLGNQATVQAGVPATQMVALSKVMDTLEEYRDELVRLKGEA